MNNNCNCQQTQGQIDRGGHPFTTNLKRNTIQNKNFRTALWTGDYLQLTMMSIPVKGDIGAEIHEDTDQFFYLESGHAFVKMGSDCNCSDYRRNLFPGCAVFVPAGTWHNIINTGNTPLKVFSVYAPPHHPKGTINRTKDSSNY